MFKYLSIVAALLSVLLYYAKPLPYAGWFAGAAAAFGFGYGLISLLKEKDSGGKTSIKLNVVAMLILLLGQ
ncbi:hypothetical protein DRW41_11205 [Neobacillus piezotolerans]|uniref:DUF3953 domain-containing protein n=1 Tax=Neobacillus piezotolerans TaxID=2259171 RepID=A0A3D8GQR5_9BACI|nr:hypothetical protein [Neobacillus piezotolerans]RDU36621.1 hypothetical protein DRW41_11205 [Neobacillus piezotolerans]